MLRSHVVHPWSVGGALLLLAAAGCAVDEQHFEPVVDASVADAPEVVDGDPVDGSQLDAAVDASIPPDSALPQIVPTFAAISSRCDTAATNTLSVAATLQVNTSTSPLCEVVPQAGGPDICVLRYSTVSIAAGARLEATGQRVLALIADGDLAVAGTLDASARGAVDGPGSRGVSPGTASNPSPEGAGSFFGGGGAGGRTAGGSGASMTVNGGMANGGAQIANPADGATIAGGAHPAANPGGSLGGGGGGAVLLISCRGTVSVTGTVAANGGGGRPGVDSDPTVGNGLFTSGAGGGAGGTIVLQGVGVSITGSVFANGGGGGSGVPIDNQAGMPGADGRNEAAAALGGTGGNAGDGGAGGFTAAPRIGSRPAAGGATPGGGGGSSGFIATFTPASATPTVTPTLASPPVDPNRALLTR